VVQERLWRNYLRNYVAGYGATYGFVTAHLLLVFA
jgi:hypothetical protein